MNRPSGSSWTDEREQALRKYWRAGLSHKEIAELLGGVTAHTVKSKGYRMGLPHQPARSAWTEAELAKLRELHTAGLSFSAIGKKIGKTRNAAIGMARRLGLKRGMVRKLRTAYSAGAGPHPRRARPRKAATPPSPGAATLPRPAPPASSATPPSDGAEPPLSNYPNRVPLIETGSGRCKWPLWGDSSAHRDCCGNPTADGCGPYCATHAGLAFHLFSPKRQWADNDPRRDAFSARAHRRFYTKPHEETEL